MTPDPIAVLERALRGWVLAEAQLGHEVPAGVPDARRALVEMRAVVKALRHIFDNEGIALEYRPRARSALQAFTKETP